MEAYNQNKYAIIAALPLVKTRGGQQVVNGVFPEYLGTGNGQS